MGETSDVNIPELTKGQEYHAFITHNSESEGKVSRSLYTALTDKGFKCCHADINFTPGIPIVTNIMMAVTASRRVIAIVSPEFLKSNWCQFETINTLNESNDRGRQVMIPVLYNMDPELLPAYMKSMTYLENTDTNFMVKLTRAISLDVPLAASIPAGNVAHGLAWSYFYGFLNLVLPNLDERVKKSKYWSHQPEALQQAGNEGQEVTNPQTIKGQEIKGQEIKGQEMTNAQRIIPKLIIVSPCSCYCPGSFTDVDENIVFDGHIPYKATRAGNIDRDYKSSVYKVTDPDTNEVYYAILEFTTPILSLYEMEAGAIAGLNPGQMDVQRKIFETTLQEILEHENNRRCNGRAILLSYTDEKYKGSGRQEVTRLSSIIVHRIRHELHKQTEAAQLRLQIQEATEKLGQLDHGE